MLAQQGKRVFVFRKTNAIKVLMTILLISFPIAPYLLALEGYIYSIKKIKKEIPNPI